MILPVLLTTIFILSSAEARLEFCVCCEDQIGQPISENCSIPASSVNDEELQTLYQICVEYHAVYSRYDGSSYDPYYDNYYNNVYRKRDALHELFYIAYNRSNIDYLSYPDSNCDDILNTWKDTVFWISGDSSWAFKQNLNGLLSRKVVIQNTTNEEWYQMMYKQDIGSWKSYQPLTLSSNPNLETFPGLYEVLLRIIPHLSIRNITYTSEEKILTNEQTHFGTLKFITSDTALDNFTHHIKVPSLRSYELQGNFIAGSNLEVEDGNETYKTKVGALESYIADKTIAFTYESYYLYLMTHMLGQWGVIQRNFTAKLKVILLDSDPKNSLLEIESDVTGTFIDRSIIRTSLEYDHYNLFYDDGIVMEISDRVVAGMLFTLAGILILGIFFVICKKCLCCCFRDRVTTGYQRMDDSRTTTNA